MCYVIVIEYLFCGGGFVLELLMNCVLEEVELKYIVLICVIMLMFFVFLRWVLWCVSWFCWIMRCCFGVGVLISCKFEFSYVDGGLSWNLSNIMSIEVW